MINLLLQLSLHLYSLMLNGKFFFFNLMYKAMSTKFNISSKVTSSFSLKRTHKKLLINPSIDPPIKPPATGFSETPTLIQN